MKGVDFFGKPYCDEKDLSQAAHQIDGFDQEDPADPGWINIQDWVTMFDTLMSSDTNEDGRCNCTVPCQRSFYHLVADGQSQRKAESVKPVRTWISVSKYVS